MADLAEGFLGAALGALFTLSRVPRARTERNRRGGAAPSDCAANGPAESAVGTGLRLTYLGHATVMIELDGVRLLTDPVLGRRLGPLRRLGPTRIRPRSGRSTAS